MGVYEELVRLIRDSPYPPNELHNEESDPVHFADVNDVLREVSMHVDRTGVTDFSLRHEYSTGLVLVYAMDADEPRQRLRSSLEAVGFEVTERRNQYGTSLEVHPRDSDLVMTRYDQIVEAIAELLPEATDIEALQAGVEERMGIPIRTGLIRSAIDRFKMMLRIQQDGSPRADRAPSDGLARLVESAVATGVVPALCRLDQ